MAYGRRPYGRVLFARRSLDAVAVAPDTAAVVTEPQATIVAAGTATLAPPSTALVLETQVFALDAAATLAPDEGSVVLEPQVTDIDAPGSVAPGDAAVVLLPQAVPFAPTFISPDQQDIVLEVQTVSLDLADAVLLPDSGAIVFEPGVVEAEAPFIVTPNLLNVLLAPQGVTINAATALTTPSPGLVVIEAKGPDTVADAKIAIPNTCNIVLLPLADLIAPAVSFPQNVQDIVLDPQAIDIDAATTLMLPDASPVVVQPQIPVALLNPATLLPAVADVVLEALDVDVVADATMVMPSPLSVVVNPQTSTVVATAFLDVDVADVVLDPQAVDIDADAVMIMPSSSGVVLEPQLSDVDAPAVLSQGVQLVIVDVAATSGATPVSGVNIDAPASLLIDPVVPIVLNPNVGTVTAPSMQEPDAAQVIINPNEIRRIYCGFIKHGPWTIIIEVEERDQVLTDQDRVITIEVEEAIGIRQGEDC